MKALDRKFCVAPMMQYTDMHDRFLLRLISKKVFLYTEMIATGSLIYGKCFDQLEFNKEEHPVGCLLYTSPSPRDGLLSRMPSSA